MDVLTSSYNNDPIPLPRLRYLKVDVARTILIIDLLIPISLEAMDSLLMGNDLKLSGY